jgi:trigger factor
MTSSTTAERPNKVDIKDAGPSAKLVSIEIPADRVAEKLRGSVETLATEAALPGFRKGRVPRWLVEKRFGSAVRKEAKNELVSMAINQAIEDHKLRVVGDVASDTLPKLEIKDGEAFKFEVEIEVLPEFDLPALDAIPVRKPTIDVSDEMVEDEVRKLTINEGSLESRTSAEPGDYITGHAVMKDDKGTEFYNLKGAVVQKPTPDRKGRGMILGIAVDDFDGQLGSPRPGDTVTITAKGPEQHEVEGIRNANLMISFHAERVDRIVPAPIEQIVQMYGFESDGKLRETIRNRLAERVKVQQQQVMHQQMAKYLLEKVKMDLPKRLSTVQAGRTLARRRMDLMQRGVDTHKIEEHMAELRAASSAQATTDLKLFFILFRIAEELKVAVHDIEVNQRIAQMAFQRNIRPEQLRAELIQTRQINEVFQHLREAKTFDALLNKATITEMPAEEFNKIMKEEAERA